MALIQLILTSCGSDQWLTANTGTPDCANTRDSIMYWFIDRADGIAIKEDIHRCYKNTYPSRTIELSDYTHCDYDSEKLQSSML